MATVSKEIADKIMANGGYYSDDPRVMQVVRYDNFEGQPAYAILYAQDIAADRYRPTQYVNNPKVIWRAT